MENAMAFEQEAKKNFPHWPIWDEDDIEAVANVVRSGNWWCGAPAVHKGENLWKLQEEFAEFHEAKYCCAVFNGTVTLETALASLDVGLGDEVIVPDYTFVATGSAVVATNAVPIFCDIDPETLVMDVNKVESLITPRTKAIIPVHLGGNPVEMDHLMEIADAHDLKVIEDCAHAHGTRYKGKRVGNWGQVGSFSLQASKVLTSGEGGLLICNDEELAAKMYSYADCGRHIGDYFYAHHSYGTNYRMSEFNAAICRAQLKKFPPQHALRNERGQFLTQKLNEIDGVRAVKLTPGTDECGFYVFPFVFEPNQFHGISAKDMYNALNEAGIPTDDCYPPLHGLGLFKNVLLKKGIDYSNANWGGEKSDDANFPVVSDIYSRSVEFPQEMLLSDEDQLQGVADFIRSLQ